MAVAASFVCSVARTRCPVSAACSVIAAVSASRTSPTMMTSGSCRRTWRSASAKSIPIFGWTATWLNASTTISIGSSMVTTLTSGVATVRSAA